MTRRPAVVLSLALVLMTAHASGRAAAGVKYGDAVAGVVRPSDLERIKRVLRLDRFSIIAAVWLGRRRDARPSFPSRSPTGR